jgi:hypothetical protein
MLKTIALSGACMLFASALHAQDMRMEVGPVAYRGQNAAAQVRVTNVSGIPYRELRFQCDFRSASDVIGSATFVLAVLDPNQSETVTVQAQTGDNPVYQVACRGLF